MSMLPFASHIVLASTFFLGIFATVVPATASGATIDFEGLGLAEGDPVPPIGIASFEAETAIQGGALFAFGPAAEPDTGLSPPFSNPGNTFITNPGGAGTADSKIIRITFSIPVTGLSILLADIESDGPIVEQATGTVFDAALTPLGSITHTAPVPDLGDQSVISMSFGAIDGIRRLDVSLTDLGSSGGSFGFGLDNLTFVPEPSTALLLAFGLAVMAVTHSHRGR